MKLWSDSFKDGAAIPGQFAFGVADPTTHVALSDNKNPHFAWSDVPGDAKSLVLICHDRDVPSRGDDVNQEGKTIPADLPRVDFFHWVLIDIPVSSAAIKAGEYSNGIQAHGKSGPEITDHALIGARHGLNDYTGWFAGDPDMAGDYFGYDGPCPPWNDSIVHHYVFTLYALDIARTPVDGKFTGMQVRDAIQDHVLAQANITGTYSLNPAIAQSATK